MNYKLLALLIVLPITNTFAGICPDLAGKYLCNFQNSDGTETVSEIKISQNNQNALTTYFINDSERIADGEEHSTPISGLSDVKYTATCDESVTFHLDANVLNSEGRIIGNMFSHLLMYKMNDYLRFYEMGSYSLETEYTPFERESVCKPIN